jgi:hypothetical protein
MKMLALSAALLLVASPVAAQSPQQALGAAGQTNTSTLPDTGIICNELVTATFCNVSTSPNNGGMVQVPVQHRAELALPRLLRLSRPARRFRRPTNYAIDRPRRTPTWCWRRLKASSA